jgi:DNA-binding NarL/FixJ family response regulator
MRRITGRGKFMYWKKVLSEVLNKQSNRNFAFTNFRKEHCQKSENPKPPFIKPKKYSLGSKFAGIHFSQREADCMLQMWRGKSIDGIAKHTHLSPRTVEYYVKNIKKKVGCRTKFELIELVIDSEFLNNFGTNSKIEKV